MYETIMDLPLFKGISEDQLSLMLEKTSMEFLKYEDGALIHEATEPVKSIDFILGGKVRVSHELENFPINVDEVLGKGAIPGATHLFGMNTTYGCNISALGKVSLMRIDKSQYMNLLMSDRIYMMNFVNYISAWAQKAETLLIRGKGCSIMDKLQLLAGILVSRKAETVLISGEDNSLTRYCGVKEEEFKDWKMVEVSANRIHLIPQGIILKERRAEK